MNPLSFSSNSEKVKYANESNSLSLIKYIIIRFLIIYLFLDYCDIIFFIELIFLAAIVVLNYWKFTSLGYNVKSFSIMHV